MNRYTCQWIPFPSVMRPTGDDTELPFVICLFQLASSPSIRRLAASSVPPAAKSSKAFSVTRMM
jgi:hypothetical protein